MKNYLSLLGQSIALGSVLAGSVAVGGAIAEPFTLARSESQTIESLPNGDYYYKSVTSWNEKLSFRFRKNGKIVSAWQGSLTELTACIVGEVKHNSIIKGFKYIQGYGNERSQYSFIKDPIDLSSLTPLTLQDAKNSNPVVANYIRNQLKRKVLRGCENQAGLLMDRFVAAYGDPKSPQNLQVESAKQVPKSDDDTVSPQTYPIDTATTPISSSTDPNSNKNRDSLCRVGGSTYQAIGKPEFSVRFNGRNKNSQVPQLLVTIKSQKRGEIFIAY